MRGLPKWLLYATGSLLIWAAWSLLSPIASAGLSGSMVQILSSAGLAPVVLLLLFSKRLWRGSNLPKGLSLAVATGFLAGLGNVMLYNSLDSGGPVSVVFPLSSLAPLIPVLAAPILFRERINRFQACGIAVALVAMVLLNTNASSTTNVSTSGLVSKWMAYAVLSMLIFGVTYLPQKGATYFISDELSTVAFAAGFAVLDVALLVADQSLVWNIPAKAGAVSVLIGVLMGVGSLTLFMAYRHGKASVVTPYVQLFPVVSVLLAVPIYHERIDIWRGLGVAAAIGAGVMLSMEREQPLPAAAPAQ